MSKNEFKRLFIANTLRALGFAEGILGRTLSREFTIELHGEGIPGQIVSMDRAIDIMYIDENQFHPIIDIGVKEVRADKAIVFVRISAHEPRDFEHTWNSPKGSGPFKVIEPMHIEVR